MITWTCNICGATVQADTVKIARYMLADHYLRHHNRAPF